MSGRAVFDLLKLLALSFLLSSAANSSALAATEIRIASEDGDFVGRGETFILSEGTGVLTIDGLSTSEIKLEWRSSTNNFDLNFGGANGQTLAVGLFDDAQRYPFMDPDHPGLSISGNGAGCNMLIGQFEVYELEFDQNGIATKLALDAIQHCESSPRKLFAEIRINSDVPFNLGPQVTTQADVVVAPNTSTVLQLTTATTTNGIIENYQWTQVYGPSVVVSGASTDTLSFTTPVSDREYEVLIFSVLITDSAGEQAADKVTVVSSETSIPAFRYRLLTTPTGFIAGTENVETDFDPSHLTIDRNRNQLLFTYDPPDTFGWHMTIAVPQGEDFRVGQFDTAFRVPFQPANKPGADFGLDGRGCNRLVAEYNILDIGMAENLAITRIALDATIICTDLGADPMHIRLRYDSVVPFDTRAPIAEAGPDLVAFPGDLVELDAYASRNDFGKIVNLSWRQTAGLAVALQNTGTDIASFVAPDVPQGGGLLEFELRVENEFGYVDTELVEVTIQGSEDPRNLVTLRVDPGTGYDFVTNSSGIDLRFDENEGYFSINRNLRSNNLQFDGFTTWFFRFGSDAGLLSGDPLLTPGIYDPARRSGDGFALFSAAGDGRGCNQTHGRFIVHEYVDDTNGALQSLAVDFELLCDFGAPLHGKVRYQSTVALDAAGLFANAGEDLEAVPGQQITLDAGNSYVGPTAGVSYQWQQISGPAITLSDANQATPSFLAPDIAGTVTFQVTITTAEGLVDTALVTITLLGPGVPLTAMIIKSEPGDPLLYGSQHFFNSTEVGGREYSSDQIVISDFSGRMYRLTLSAPNGDTLVPGDYLGGVGFGAIEGFPGIDLEYAIRGCVVAGGWFRIHEIESNVGGDLIEKLAVDFYQSCGESTPPLYGALRINSTVPLQQLAPVVTAGPPITGRTGFDIPLSAEDSFSWGGPIISYEWIQTSGPLALISDSSAAKPTISLPPTTQPSQALRFEVTVTNALGGQDSAGVTVTDLDASEPWSEISVVVFDPVTRVELDSYVASPNTSHFKSSIFDVTRDIFISTRFRTMDLRFTTGGNVPDVVEGLFHRRDYRDDEFPEVVLQSAFNFTCNLQSQGWMDIKDVGINNGIIDSISFETEQICEGVGVRVSGRINSSTPILYGTPVIKTPPDGLIVEGDTVRIDDSIAYIEGELASNVDWIQSSGPNAKLAKMINARTAFVAPATDGDSQIQLGLTLEARDQSVYSEQLILTVTDNSIAGFPAGLVSTYTETGAYDGTGGAIAVDSDALIILEPRTPEVRSGGDEPGVAPYGLIGMEFESGIGETISVTIHFDEVLHDEATLLMKEEFFFWSVFNGQWSIAADRLSVTFEVTDGGTGDWDNIVDGRSRVSVGIGHPSAPEPPPPPPPPPGPDPTPTSSGGGGSTDPMFLLFAGLVLLRRLTASRMASSFCCR
jgi:hypothetical protein